jgi:hypothetical protein
MTVFLIVASRIAHRTLLRTIPQLRHNDEILLQEYQIIKRESRDNLMKLPRTIFVPTLFLAFFSISASSCSAQESRPNGMYALLKTTKGTIVISLEFEKAPLTVGNFVGLAEGKLDATKGKPFYNNQARCDGM